MTIALDQKLLAHLKTTRLFDPPGLALLAVSGGPDSVAMLDLMFCVEEELSLGLAVAHVAHGISPEAARAAPQVQKLAHSYRVPFFLEQLELGSNATETSARHARYEALRSIQAEVGANYLVTAHHLDDQIETVLYRLLRGSGMAGLSGIPAQGPNGLVRPLLPFDRAELADWLSLRFPDPASRPAVFDDPANSDERHDRSWLRHHLLPFLRRRFGPDLDRRLAEVALHAGENRAAWAAVLHTLPDLGFLRESETIEVARKPIARYDKLLSQAVLRAAALEVGCRLGRTQSELLLEFASGSSSGHTLQLGSDFQATLVFDRLKIGRKATLGSADAVDLELSEGSEGNISWEGWQFVWQTDTAESCRRDSQETWITYGPCEVRPPREGDRIRPLGGVGTRKLRRVLMEARVPATDRCRFPIVCRGSDVLWVPGICRSDKAVPNAGDRAVRLEARAG
jgi:tRNA(Ile)-lysidine synthase